MQTISKSINKLLLLSYLSASSCLAAGESIIKSEPLAGIGAAAPDLQIGKRVLIATAFLIALWLFLKYVADKIKAGEVPLPKFLIGKTAIWSQLNKFRKKEVPEEFKHPNFNLDPIQQKIFADGSELLVLENNGRYLLCSKSIQAGIQYLTELENPEKVTKPIPDPLEAENKNNLSQI